MSSPEQFPSSRTSPEVSLQARVRNWQNLLDKIPYDEDSAQLRRSAELDLDDYLPYGGELCTFRGIGTVEASDDGKPAYQEIFDCDDGLSQGFVVARVGQEHTWRVCYGFELLRAFAPRPGSQRQVYLYPENSSIMPYSAVDEAYKGIQIPHFIIDEEAAAMAQAMRQPEFFELDAAEQLYYIDSSLNKLKKTVEKWGGIHKPVVIENCETVFILSIDGTNNYHNYERICTADSVITGVCKGLEVPARHQIAGGRAVTHTKQLVDKRAGVFLKVEIDAETAKRLSLPPQECYIAVGGQDFDLSFSQTATTHSNESEPSGA